ncbi:hypothetical protein TREMEDRAFT_63814 [Tremella mesenterica DSM 1558]|uniref:uncharacterized protein n=1 Tax=Tremella mesenterica (strain ATCC 24925 / CBS 8224 / DSM 1558 / NBRC 9311 / NRRL Y-6157 / RJB 2259-6 / UBC 559-6) TaxID=578456 RepID=UPI0003F4A387|nr:uncharacterized protein TREMEDRAFT_63814 [Tremella mesenterica DSM 1558]EIW67926.1 hypothetical protein TREMEDRAFT_63814 [Tremella mesenterica DSM 1558]
MRPQSVPSDRCVLLQTSHPWHLGVALWSDEQDEGRLYQAQNDDYVLPADQKEMSRLDHQHYGCKLFQKGKNYVVPMDKVLENRGEGRRGLDVGCGTGVWVIEMAREFDKAEWVGVDLAPIQTDSDLPDNLTFIHEDAVRGLPYPDEYFDLIHCRVLYMGIRNWKDLVDEVARLLRPGGMAVFVEVEGRWSLHEKTREEEIKIAPGFSKFCDYLAMATEKRGLDVDAAKTNIVKYIRQNGTLEDVEQLRMFIPLSPWSDEPHMKASGKIMLVDAIEIPDAVRHLILDAAEISPSKFEELKKGWIDDVHNPSCHVGAYYWHNTARKKLHSVDEESLLKNDVQE